MEKMKFWQRKSLMDLLLLASTLGALGLFAAPSTVLSLMLAGIFCLTLFCVILRWKEPAWVPQFRLGAAVLALSFAVSGILVMPESLGKLLSSRPLLYGTAAVLAAGGYYAFYRLALWMEAEICRILSLPLQRPEGFPLSNLLLPLSAVGFFSMESHWLPDRVAAGLVAAALIFLICLHSPDLLSKTLEQPAALQLPALGSCLGILLLRIQQADTGIFCIAAALLALPFLYLCVCQGCRWIFARFRSLQTFRDISRWEWIFYGVLFLSASLFTVLLFNCTDAFYGTVHDFDVIYTSDSPELFNENAYLSLRGLQNDLRQPLFAVFAAPILGLPYLISRLLPHSEIFYVLAMSLPQIALMMLSFFLAARMLNLTGGKRMLLMGLFCASYPALLFTLMMEQYIIACFYLLLCIYLIVSKAPETEISLYAAGGTLLTSLILMPALTDLHPIRQFKDWFARMLQLVLGFVIFLLAFGRLDIILNAPTSLLMMMKFSGRSVFLSEKLFQYSGFFRSCLIAPEAGVDLQTMGYPSWQLNPAVGFSAAGLVILFLAVVSAILNRKDRACRAAGLWLGFSFLVLVVLGWGTPENGLILYALYFGWAVILLLFALVQKLEQRIPRLTWWIGIPAIAALLTVNLPAIAHLVGFALRYYPI